jgi:hypothetical protein
LKLKPLPFAHASSCSKLGHHQRGREVPVVADHHDLRHQLVGFELALDRLRRDFLAARRDQDVLLTVL